MVVIEVAAVKTLDEVIDKLVGSRRNPEAIGMKAARSKHLVRAKPCASRLAIIRGTIGLHDGECGTVDAAEEVSAPGKFVIDGLKEGGAGQAGDFIHDARHVLEVIVIDHEVDAGIELFRKPLIPGEDAICLALVRERCEQNAGEVGLDAQGPCRPVSGLRYILRNQS